MDTYRLIGSIIVALIIVTAVLLIYDHFSDSFSIKEMLGMSDESKSAPSGPTPTPNTTTPTSSNAAAASNAQQATKEAYDSSYPSPALRRAPPGQPAILKPQPIKKEAYDNTSKKITRDMIVNKALT